MRTNFWRAACLCTLQGLPLLLPAQGGWTFETDPLSDVTQYTTIYPYSGASFVDVNNDHYPDIFASPNTLLINNGNGTFTFGSPLPYTLMQSTAGSSWADLDNDNDIDCAIACVPSGIFFNNGNNTFSDSSSLVPSFTNYGSWAVAIGDYNEDPALDFIFAHANGYHPPALPEPCKFYKQTGSWFNPQQVGGFPFTTNLSSYTNPFWSDYDLDGDMDLFIASGPVVAPGFDPCYKNMKMETGIDSLQPMTTELFATQTQDGQCYNFIDYDNDRDLDLCLSNYYNVATRLYRNNGGGNYTIVNTPFSTATTNLTNCWGDYDNDGDQDVIITNDNQVSKYYRNNGNGTFVFLSWGFSTLTAVCSVVNADVDNDGDLDVFANGVGNNGNTISVGLYKNDTVAGNRNFVNLHLTGIASNRSAIGAIVRLRAVINNVPVWQMREVNAQNSFQGQNDLRVHFGLGNATVIDSMSITWPAGTVDNFYNTAANNFYEIIEGSGIINLSIATPSQAELSFALGPNPADEWLHLSIDHPGDDITYTIYDLNGRIIRSGEMDGKNKSLYIGGMSEGMYLLRVSSKKGSAVQKFIKSRL